MCFRRNKNLKDFLWKKTIVNNKAQKVKLSNRKGYSIPCHFKAENLCCKQVKHANTFSSIDTKRSYNTYNKLHCKSSFLMECTLCKRQHTCASETAFNIGSITIVMTCISPTCQKHTKFLDYPVTILINTQFFTLIEQLNNTELDKSY